MNIKPCIPWETERMYHDFHRYFLEEFDLQPRLVRRIIHAALIASILILGTWYASSQQAFIYFQF